MQVRNATKHARHPKPARHNRDYVSFHRTLRNGADSGIQLLEPTEQTEQAARRGSEIQRAESMRTRAPGERAPGVEMWPKKAEEEKKKGDLRKNQDPTLTNDARAGRRRKRA